MSLFKTFKTDTKKENDGIPITYGENEDGTIPTFYIARSSKSNKKYKNAISKLSKPHKRKMELGTLDDATGERIMRKSFIQGCLKGWANIRDEDDNKVSFSESAAEELFTQLPELFEDLQEQSNNIANFRMEELEEDAKN